MTDEKCFQCNDAEKVFVNTAEEMLGGRYKCPYDYRIKNGRNSCNISLHTKQLSNDVRHMNCKYCDLEKSYCTYHHKNILDIMNGKTCWHYIWK